jgi:hypothetical protein
MLSRIMAALRRREPLAIQARAYATVCTNSLAAPGTGGIGYEFFEVAMDFPPPPAPGLPAFIAGPSRSALAD